MHKRLGCLAPQGLVAAGLTLVLVVVALLLWGGRPFSPGPLNAQAGAESLGGVRSHAETGGRCSACHVAPWSEETMSDRCLACHVEVQGQLSDAAGLHGALAARESVRPCYNCHGEHGGAGAALTHLEGDDFPHQATGFSLEGHGETAAGNAFVCGDCHGQDLTSFDAATCAECHREMDAAFLQAHVDAFGHGCLACHDGVDRYGAAFDHDRLAFPLEGAHEAVDCAGCHPGARTPADLQAAPQDCYACHDEPAYHTGLFDPDCAGCHDTAAWSPAEFDRAHTFPFDHGEEGVSPCATCHPDGLAAYTCYECHEHEPAEIAEEHRDEGIADFEDCVECHPTGSEDEAEGEGGDD